MKRRRQTMFAAVDKHGWYAPFAFSGAASTARRELGEAWRNENESARQGWERAKKYGYRIVKVEVRRVRT